MAQSPLNSQRRDEAAEFNLREWGVKARMISRENTRSRRFSSSNYITSFREECSRSFRTNIIISSTASSPGYNLKEEINPSTYSFSSALRALQARSVNTWECLPPEGFALNSKWNEAEKYICNPLSGEVPLECLSAKTLTGSSFRNLTSRITMSAPLIYPSHSRVIQTKPCFNNALFGYDNDEEAHFYNIIKEQKAAKMFSRDVGVQSKLSGLPSSTVTSTPASTPQLGEISPKSNDPATAAGNSPNSSPQLKPEEEEKGEEMKETDGCKEENSERKEEEIMKTEAGEKQVHHQNTMWKCRRNIGCLSLKSLWRTRNSDKQKSRNSASKKKRNIFPLPCYIPNNSNKNISNNSEC